MEKKRTPDGEGGWATEWTPGAEFDAAIILDTSMQSRIAEKELFATISLDTDEYERKLKDSENKTSTFADVLKSRSTPSPNLLTQVTTKSSTIPTSLSPYLRATGKSVSSPLAR